MQLQDEVIDVVGDLTLCTPANHQSVVEELTNHKKD